MEIKLVKKNRSPALQYLSLQNYKKNITWWVSENEHLHISGNGSGSTKLTMLTNYYLLKI